MAKFFGVDSLPLTDGEERYWKAENTNAPICAALSALMLSGTESSGLKKTRPFRFLP